jgi:ketosteroid isomerase-like protein
MNHVLKYGLLTTVSLLLLSISCCAQADARASAEIIPAMEKAAQSWNNSDLEGYMSLYDSSATMMTADGRIGLNGIRQVFLKYYFVNGKRLQVLHYDRYQLTMLGDDYALLTGRFILDASDKLPRRTGIFSLTMVRRAGGWLILHDHSG